MKKVESAKSTSVFLQTCPNLQVTPKTFKYKIIPSDLNENEQEIWDNKAFETKMILVTLALGKTNRRLEGLNTNLTELKEIFVTNITAQEFLSLKHILRTLQE